MSSEDITMNVLIILNLVMMVPALCVMVYLMIKDYFKEKNKKIIMKESD